MPTVTKTYKILKFQIISFGLGVMKKKKYREGKKRERQEVGGPKVHTVTHLYLYKRERESHRNLVKN